MEILVFPEKVSPNQSGKKWNRSCHRLEFCFSAHVVKWDYRQISFLSCVINQDSARRFPTTQRISSREIAKAMFFLDVRCQGSRNRSACKDFRVPGLAFKPWDRGGYSKCSSPGLAKATFFTKVFKPWHREKILQFSKLFSSPGAWEPDATVSTRSKDSKLWDRRKHSSYRGAHHELRKPGFCRSFLVLGSVYTRPLGSDSELLGFH